MNADRSALWAPLLITAALAAGTFWLDRVSRLPDTQRDASTGGKPDVTMERFKATQTGENGAAQYQVTAAKMQHYQQGNYTDLFTVEMVDMTPRRPPMRIVAESVRLSHNDENYYFNGITHITREADAQRSAMKLTTSKLWVWPERGVSTTDQAVDIRDDYMHITAVGMDLDRNLGTIKLKSRVRATYVKPPA
ncbi:lipopolysaccharide export system protein LptC [Chitinivorax tropicus]|uniref:Lipopolysaccharide export system protein LptC n=1 Tax=Chitinivorax tropicus TaxID=714531 RepID=A0A840MST9_9PROT|nr:LPS export ABC transporter periplasmic protein LptC [Chitinivorax tropicus]MBB5019466.1 lipopolysaccharide export system protein LptC [Chitinivorax tropicus]